MQHYPSTMDRLANDRKLAQVLNEAKSCGIPVEDLGEIITDYFAKRNDDPDDFAGESYFRAVAMSCHSYHDRRPVQHAV